MPKTSPRDRLTFRCVECGWRTTKWVGRCGDCRAWGAVTDEAPVVDGVTARPVSTPARPLPEIAADPVGARPTGLDEVDRVLGGGLVPGAVILVAGEPGVGKSTLLLEVAAAMAGPERRSLVVTGEESAAQVRMRAGRIEALDPSLYLAAETDLGAALGQVDQVRPSLLVIDSVQALSSPEVDGLPGGVSQVRGVATALTRVAKERNITTLLVGHVTKDGSVAGPKVLEHLVDVVLYFEGDRHSRLRTVRAVKNRFGPCDEVGCFDLADEGIFCLPDPSGLFLSRQVDPVPGTCVTVTLEGKRPLLAEVQALVAPSPYNSPRRATSGLDASRVAMVLAVLERRGRVRLGSQDVYAATVGGARLTEPSVDLAMALAMASAAHDRPLPPGLVAIGEVGLAGEVRPVSGLQRRLTEAARLGFDTALVPPDTARIPDGIRKLEVDGLTCALEFVCPGVSG